MKAEGENKKLSKEENHFHSLKSKHTENRDCCKELLCWTADLQNNF